MTTSQDWNIRTLLEGHAALRNMLAQVPARSMPNTLLLGLARIERQLRPVGEITSQRREALAAELGIPLSDDKTRYVPPEGEDGRQRFEEFQAVMNDWMSAPYKIDIEPVLWEEAVAAIPGLTPLHYTLMPFAFSLQGG